ncbi:hypothetical protein LIER_33325 [Lithospermum erythrorhizon]|uniref:Uncharacterized protein n=1 Tax=Lithospermum erythrorhizon TaxID=34254 RepID=A0AAV3RXS8_LITER
MDYFFELLKSKVDTGDFDFHPGYDLFILCKANEKSLKTIKRMLEMFGDFFGLRPNLARSTCYFVKTDQ